ncbi:MAG: AAA family ATPase [Clostridia bacterium]|nr:AAA family ATPase [Clostridia bacterium]
MVFYKIDAVMVGDDSQVEMNRQQQKARANDIAEKSEGFFQKSDQNTLMFVVGILDGKITLGCISKGNDNINDILAKYVKLLPFEIEKHKTEEITFSALQSLLSCADRNEYIGGDTDVLDIFEISSLTSRYSDADFGEALINVKKSPLEIKETAESLLFGGTMLPEIERIYQNSTSKNVSGHPVHYIVQTNDRDVRKSIYKNLLSALYASGRIKNQRYCFVDFDECSRFPGATLDTIYRCSFGGAVVIRFTSEDAAAGEFGRRGHDIVAAVCEMAHKYKNKVLTIICLPAAANEIKEAFLMNFGNTAFVELHEDVVFTDKAFDFLKSKAKEHKVRVDKNLLNKINENQGYTSSNLNEIFDDWFSKKLRNEIYPAYKTAETVKAKIKEETPKGTSYEKLQSLIGLENAKGVMNKALNYYKVQKLFADKGLKNETPSMHMVFTGNPGTAKTTVARLFADILKENGILTNGDMYEVGRADLVGKYVGHTAPLVQAAFRRAKGGVLFIDEAYSLVDDKDGLFGDEAINTIVQEMENHRKDTIVIFAGYPDKMEDFLNKNPGLRSRIAFHIPFDDYNCEELCEIAELIASEKGFRIEQDAKNKLSGIFCEASKRSDFGNGRFARNIIEKAKMAQAERLVNMPFDEISDKEIFTLVAEDFEIPLEIKQEKTIKIGFCA